MMNCVDIAPLRSLSDFLLESARFQVPNFKDKEKWINRVRNNLLYYQTNYFLTFLFILIGSGFMYPEKFLRVVFVIIYLPNALILGVKIKQNHSIRSLFILILGGYFLVTLSDGMSVVFLYGIILPIIIILIHSSLRLRDIRNKVSNLLENIGFKKTPMGLFLAYLDQKVLVSKALKKEM